MNATQKNQALIVCAGAGLVFAAVYQSAKSNSIIVLGLTLVGLVICIPMLIRITKSAGTISPPAAVTPEAPNEAKSPAEPQTAAETPSSPIPADDAALAQALAKLVALHQLGPSWVAKADERLGELVILADLKK